MADRNKNGIDDKYESSYGRTRPGEKSDLKITGKQPEGLAALWQGFQQGPLRAGANFMGSVGSFLTSTPDAPKGRNIGDQLFGVPIPARRPGNRSGGGGGSFGPPPGSPDPAQPKPKGLLDYLAEAGGIVDQLGIGGGGPSGPPIQAVDYSPAMALARERAGSNRANLGAVYNQLRQGLESDRGSISQNYGGAIDRSQEIAQNAQQTTRSAWDAAAAQQEQAAAALGMQSAAAAQQFDRPTTQQRAADDIADSAAIAQNAQQQYNSQQANSLTHNSNVNSASRFAETRALGELDMSLDDRLAQLAQLQAQANAEAQAQNASLYGGGDSGQRGSSILSLAQSLYGDAQSSSQQDFENQIAAAKLAGQQAAPPPGYTLEQLMKGQQQSGLNTQDYTTFMKLLASLNG